MPLVTRNLPKKNAVLFLARAAQRTERRPKGRRSCRAVDNRTGCLADWCGDCLREKKSPSISERER